MKKYKPIWKSLRLAALIVVGIIIYAFGFQVTQMGFEEINSPTRQASLTRVIRTLFHPDIIEYDQVQVRVETPFYTPCPTGSVDLPEPDRTGAYLVATPKCSLPRSEITVEGFKLQSNYRGQLYFIPPSGVSLGLTTFETDDEGHFSVKAKIPPRPSDQVQYIRTTISNNVGKPRFSKTATDTWEKIIETVFLALLATTFGIIFAVPVSFMAARNIMRDVTMPMSSLSLTIIAWPLGVWIGGSIASWLGEQTKIITENSAFTLLGVLIGGLLIWLLIKWAMPEEEENPPGRWLRIGRIAAILAAVVIGIISLFLLANLAIQSGGRFANEPGFIGMMGSFVENLGVILQLLIPVIVAFGVGGVMSNMFTRAARHYISPLKPSIRFPINLVLGALAGALVAALIGAAINWIYQINNPIWTFWVPALIGAALGIFTVISNREKDKLPIGMTIYYTTRTILNGLRAIEALIWVIIFVVWVGIGPFAGVLALALHTVAALGKLYSEQVESIMPGPLEAVKATGATRIQVIVYSVVPQIVPLYISFTMYRWDINVRMSTIIGFAGGGGIGFLLLQNINLLNYRAASTQMIAIAVVVALMDYLSSYMREKIV